jgi:hypothetical protein
MAALLGQTARRTQPRVSHGDRPGDRRVLNHHHSPDGHQLGLITNSATLPGSQQALDEICTLIKISINKEKEKDD